MDTVGKERRLRRHLEFVTCDSIIDAEGEQIKYRVYECEYCDDSVRMSKRRFSKAPFEDYIEWGQPAERHLKDEHGISVTSSPP